MSQTHSRRMTERAFCRSIAFRSGYEDRRTDATPRFGEWGNRSIAYERGRQAAAFAQAAGFAVRPIPTDKRISDQDLAWLVGLAWEVEAVDRPWMRELPRWDTRWGAAI